MLQYIRCHSLSTWMHADATSLRFTNPHEKAELFINSYEPEEETNAEQSHSEQVHCESEKTRHSTHVDNLVKY